MPDGALVAIYIVNAVFVLLYAVEEVVACRRGAYCPHPNQIDAMGFVNTGRTTGPCLAWMMLVGGEGKGLLTMRWNMAIC